MATTTRVKICGINSPEAYEAARGADWIGFVFFPPSPRFVTPARAASLAAAPGPARVGLFVDSTDAAIEEALATVRLDALQILAGLDRAAAIRTRFGMPVWHVAGVAGPDDLPASAAGVDRLLLDAKAPHGAELPGGNAQRFDWSVLRGWAAPAPWVLAGGLTPGNVAEAIAAMGAPAVDVSSGVEKARGVKDPALIEAFLRAARGR